MRKKYYQNEYLGQSKPELKKVWENLWDRILTLNPQKDYIILYGIEVEKPIDTPVEALHDHALFSSLDIFSVPS